ncbi:alpha/beta hydrolase [Streptococcus sp. SQ9-PEA]|uniref:Alpha/beta hydrolase n=2 Tax=Streptococcus sciuri TaxID=2973939 RepID=A0ABT2F5R3_9STRE|nr:alpha/beta hydrolase [Streptococcus sciuri]MCS4487772.1 alpha/beta hydrolase [Streptococcus sciuri]
MAVFGRHYINNLTTTQYRINNSKMNPTILVPGSSAGQERFNTLLEQLNKMGEKHSVLKLTVKTSGKIVYTGKLDTNDRKPYIVIAFENNQDGYKNIKKQATWLNEAMLALQKRYKFKRFNAIGHSNGGLNWTIFLEQYIESDDFEIKTLITIGTPYNFEESNLSNRTQMLKDLIAQKENIPSELSVYNLAGTNTYDADKIVPLASVEAGKYIYQKIVKHYTQVTVTGDDASHSDLPSNPEVIRYIAEKIVYKDKKEKEGAKL